jgi:hypothetical protein
MKAIASSLTFDRRGYSWGAVSSSPLRRRSPCEAEPTELVSQLEFLVRELARAVAERPVSA